MRGPPLGTASATFKVPKDRTRRTKQGSWALIGKFAMLIQPREYENSLRHVSIEKFTRFNLLIYNNAIFVLICARILIKFNLIIKLYFLQLTFKSGKCVLV